MIGEEDTQNRAADCVKKTAYASAQFDRVKTHFSPSKPAASKEASPTLRSVEPPSKAGMPIADLLSILLGPQSVHAEDVASRPASTDSNRVSGSESPKPAAEPVQGPALIVPEEMVALFQQRKQDLERRENIVRTAEGRVAILKAEVEQILNKIEAAEQRRLDQEKVAVGQQNSQREHASELRKQHLGQLAKIYESMPAEEAAARIERMADRKALEILRLLKSKSAGAILAQVRVDRAAKLTEELLAAP
jgi:flagellar motility protein MotE (MotC chaperone)